jgi:hypothetical protein
VRGHRVPDRPGGPPGAAGRADPPRARPDGPQLRDELGSAGPVRSANAAADLRVDELRTLRGPRPKEKTEAEKERAEERKQRAAEMRKRDEQQPKEQPEQRHQKEEQERTKQKGGKG